MCFILHDWQQLIASAISTLWSGKTQTPLHTLVSGHLISHVCMPSPWQKPVDGCLKGSRGNWLARWQWIVVAIIVKCCTVLRPSHLLHPLLSTGHESGTLIFLLVWNRPARMQGPKRAAWLNISSGNAAKKTWKVEKNRRTDWSHSGNLEKIVFGHMFDHQGLANYLTALEGP